MSTLVLILLVLLGLVLVGFVGGALAVRRRERLDGPGFEAAVHAADRALEAARASDRGWDPSVMEQVARDALSREHPDVEYGELLLVLVDDRPGVEEDRAHFVAVGRNERSRLVLGRKPAGEWHVEQVEPAAGP